MIINPNIITEANILIEEPGKELMSINEYNYLYNLSVLMTKNAEPYAMPFSLIPNPNRLGFMVRTDDKHFRIQLGGEFDHCMYRGQNRDYPYFIPSLQRIADNELEYAVAWLKAEEFKYTFMNTPYYIRLSQMKVFGSTFDFDLDAIAQHYGFATNYLDTTTNFNTALFFAYTFINKSGHYCPITDFSDYSPTLYVSPIHRFSICEENKCSIVGFQSTLRPVTQKALAINAEKYENIKSSFRKIELPKDPTYSLGVFNSFHKGALLFPNEPIAEIANTIKNSKIIVLPLLKKFCKDYNKNFYNLSKKLKQSGYEIKNEILLFSDELICKMHFEITMNILPWIDRNIGFRGTCKSINCSETASSKQAS